MCVPAAQGPPPWTTADLLGRTASFSVHKPKVPKKPMVQAAATTDSKTENVPEPRALSKEWWIRENNRISKAMVICEVCLRLDVSQFDPIHRAPEPTKQVTNDPTQTNLMSARRVEPASE
jgi:hypothetical protein